MNKNFKKLLTFIVVFSMVLGMGVSFASNTYTSKNGLLTITGSSTNTHTAARLAWFDINDNLYIAINSTHTMDSVMTLEGSIKSDNSIELGIGVLLELDNNDYSPKMNIQGNTDAARWTIYRFNASSLLTGTKTIYVKGVGIGHDIKDQSITLPDPVTPKYTVRYEPGTQGTFTAQVTGSLNYGDPTPAAPAETPGNPGYTFTGWSPVPSPTVTGNATYVAQWSSDEYTVRYEPGTQGTFTAQVTGSLNYGNPTPAAPAETPGNPGHTFTGWSPVPSPTVTGNATYVAQWTINEVQPPVNPPVQPPIFIMTTYSLNFVAESGGTLEGTTTMNAVAGTVWSLINVPTPVANEGFEFVGWDIEFPANIYQNWTFTARFAEIEVIELEEEEVPEAAPEVEEEIEVEEPIEIEEEETPEATPTLPKTGYVDPMAVSGIGIALLGLGFALRKRNK